MIFDSAHRDECVNQKMGRKSTEKNITCIKKTKKINKQLKLPFVQQKLPALLQQNKRQPSMVEQMFQQKKDQLKEARKLKKQIKQGHKIIKSFTCEQCDKIFDRKKRLLNHFEKHHTFNEQIRPLSIVDPEMFRIVQDNLSQQIVETEVEKRLKRIEMKLVDFEVDKSGVESQLLAIKVMNDYGNHINKILQKKLTIEFQKSKVNREQINQISLALLSMVIEMPVENLFLNPSKMLQDIHQAVRKKLEQKQASSRSFNRLQNSHKFFLNIPFSKLKAQYGLLQALQNCLPTQKRDYVNYYKKLVSLAPQAYGLAPLVPSLQAFTAFKPIKRKIITIEDVKKEIKNLWKKKQLKLATDLYFTVVLGLRKSDLIRINIKSSGGVFVRVVQIFQKKNRHFTNRCIPQSLCKLIFLSENIYPLSVQRLTHVRNHALTVFGQFYGLRHTCLTNLFKQIMKQANFDVHKSSETTLKHYIDTQLYQITDKAFQLPIQGDINIPFSDIKLRYEQFGPPIQFQINSQIDEFVIKYNISEKVDDLIQDNILSDETQVNTSHSKQFQNKLQSYQLRNEIFKKFNQQLETAFQIDNLTVLDLAYQIIDEKSYSNFFTWVEDQANKRQILESLNSFDTLFQLFRIFFNRKVFLVNKYSEIQKNDFPIVKEDNDILVCENKLSKSSLINQRSCIDPNKSQNTQNNLKKQKRKNYISISYSLICVCGLPRLVRISENEDCWLFQCRRKNCKDFVSQFKEIDVKRIKTRDSVTVVNKSKKVSSLVRKSVHFSQKRNNIFERVTLNEPQSYRQHSEYDDCIPNEIFVQMPFFSKEVNEAIIQNRKNQKYIPVQIKESSIPKAGLGIIVREFIPKDSIVITYSGLITLHDRVKVNENSIFQLGKLQNTHLLFILPRYRFNGGRFINGINFTSQFKCNPNCKSVMGLHEYSKSKYEIVVYIYSIKDLHPGDELLYQYGKNYNFC